MNYILNYLLRWIITIIIIVAIFYFIWNKIKNSAPVQALKSSYNFIKNPVSSVNSLNPF